MKRLWLVVLIVLAGCGSPVEPRPMCKGWSTEVSTGAGYWHVPCDNVTYKDTIQ